jgi:WD40 repeat protein
LLGTLLATYRGHSGLITNLSWSPDGNFIASISDDKREFGHSRAMNEILDKRYDMSGRRKLRQIHVWNAITGETVYTASGPSNCANTIVWLPQGARIASVYTDTIVQVQDARVKDLLSTYYEYRNMTRSIAWSPDGIRLVLGGTDGFLQVWDATSGRILFDTTFAAGWGHSGRVHGLAWSPDGELIASADSTRLLIWNSVTWQLVGAYQNDIFGMTGLVWSPDGKSIAASGSTGVIRVWDSATGALLYAYEDPAWIIFALDWSPQGKYLALAVNDEMQEDAVKIWDPAHEEFIYTYRGHAGDVQAVAWSPDGTRMASGGYDETVQVWQIKEEKQRK